MRKLFITLGLIVFALSICHNAMAIAKRDYYRYTRKAKNDCTDNLSALYGFLKFYAENNNGKLPSANNAAGLMELMRYGALKEHFTCRVTKSKKLRRKSEIELEKIPYIYFGGANLQQALRQCPGLVLICDKPGSRHCNVLLADGTVFELNERMKELKIKTTRKISSCRDIVDILHHIYKYPPEVLRALQNRARLMDEELAKTKR